MRNVSHSGSPARGLWLSTAVTLVLVLALAAQVTAGRPGEVQTGAFATGDSPRMPGRAAACLTGRFDVARNVPITWWFEYGPTAAYGSRTAEREREAPVDDPLERSCGADADDVYADVDDLAYGATYHYRLVGRFRDGRIEAGEERTFAPAATALRPQQRVSFQHDEGAPGTSIVTNVRVHDAPRGSLVETNRCHELNIGAELGRARVRRRDQLVLRRVEVRRFRPEPGRPHPGLGALRAPRHRPGRPAARAGSGDRHRDLPARPARTADRDALRAPVRARVRVDQRDIARPAADAAGARERAAWVPVRIDCSGAGCPSTRLERVVRVPRGRGPYGRLRPPGYERLRPGARLRIFISRPGSFGAYRSLRVTRAEVRMSGYRCLDAERPRRIVACP